ncbi:inactive serine protease 54 [Choloepus didactylus]|uniref:inactive serine protease 54 n=1 Tax=Choloepus didactylus TaxID=27675 RepID=UPI00189D0881|nr:inactive serine protease 54 [Choloepus didactylus]
MAEMRGMLLLLLCVSHSSARCGIQKVFQRDTSQNVVFSKEFPWVVSLQNSRYKHLTFGCILSEFWILSIASTFQNRMNAVVIVGIANMDGKKIAHEEYPVNTIIIHEDFDNFSMSNNIALLKTDTAIQFNDLVQPICFLGRKPHTPPVLQNCWVSGWNPTSATGNHMTMSILRKISVKDVERCPLRKDQNTACGSNTHQEAEPTCLADPGNPVMCQVQHSDVWVLKGILSRGDKRCTIPFLYTKVENYGDWIMAKTEWVGPTLSHSRPWEKKTPLFGVLSHAPELRDAVTQKTHSGLRQAGRSRVGLRGHGWGIRGSWPANASRNSLHLIKGLSGSSRSDHGVLQPMYYDYYGGEDRLISGQNRLYVAREVTVSLVQESGTPASTGHSERTP